MSNETRLTDLRNLTTLLDNGHCTVLAASKLTQGAIVKLDEAVEKAAPAQCNNLYVRPVGRRFAALLDLLEEQEARCRRVREELEVVVKNIQSS